MNLDIELVDSYIELLLKWNQTHKLTNYKDKKAILENIEDSIYPVKFLNQDIKNCVDIGSGAGFPAIFLAMALPNVDFTLLEPLGKKFSFLSFVSSELNLKNIKVLKIRVEDLKGEKFDLVTSRAVDETNTMLRLSSHIVHKDSQIVLYKGSSEKHLNLDAIKIKNANRIYLIIKGDKCLK